MSLFDNIAAPFHPDAISWRAQSLTRDKTKAMALAYIDARDVMRRLDEACGPAGWQCDYPHANGKTICRIGIKVDDEWIWKANGAGDTDIEAEKGAISDAFKRAAVMWGVGRYLYDMKSPWAECEVGDNGKWKKWTPSGEAELRRAAEGPYLAFMRSQPPAEIPGSVAHFVDGLKVAHAKGEAAQYWTAHFSSVPKDWRDHVITEKEKLKEAA